MKNKIIVTVSAFAVLMAGAVAPSFAQQNKGAKQFAKMDTDGNGTVSEVEFLERAKKRFAKIDANGDGQLAREELQAARKARREARKTKRKKKAQ